MIDERRPDHGGHTPSGAPVPDSSSEPGQPAGSSGSHVPPTTPRHDQIREDELRYYEGLFRAEPQPAGRGPAASESGEGLDSTATQSIGMASGSAMPQAGAVVTEPVAPGPIPPPAGSPAKRPRKPGRWRRILLLVVAVLVAYFVILATVFAVSVNKISALPATQIASTAGANYLLVGSDGRQELTKKEQNRLHVGDVEGNRTDTIMILHVPLFGQPTLVSIPRDSWVPIPGNGSNKINAAFALGGPELLVQTVENTTGLHIDHYVEVGMIGVARVTDALGGVELCPERRYKDQDSNLNVKKGCQEMDGLTALAYVRMRKADPKGDIGRGERQQEYMKSATMKAMSPFTLLNPFKMFSVVTTAGDSLTVDEGTGIVNDARMGMAMGMISMGWGESTTVPIESDDYWVNGQQAVKWDTPAALALFDSLGG